MTASPWSDGGLADGISGADAAVEAVFRRLRPRSGAGAAYAVIDAARDERLYGALARWPAQRCCLFAGAIDERLAAAAPHLLELHADATSSRDLLRFGWGRSWGVCLRARAPFEMVRRQLRRLLRAVSPTGETMLFRFYDPRVLRVYLPTCTAEELAVLFDPIDEWVLEDRAGGRLLAFSRRAGKLVTGTETLG